MKPRGEKNPHLLDEDGDACHHVLNACKQFCIPFNMRLEGLVKDIYNDVKWLADIKACLSEICDVLNLKYVSPVFFIAHRWMSCYDAALNFIYLIDALTLLFYAFLNNHNKTVYFFFLCAIFKSRMLHLLIEEKLNVFRRCHQKNSQMMEQKEKMNL